MVRQQVSSVQKQREKNKQKQIQKPNTSSRSPQSFKTTDQNQSNEPQTIQLIQQPSLSSRPLPSIRQFVYMPNVEFYLNKMSSSPNGTFIDLMHKQWWGNYVILQTNHSYIQWLFPNSFQSRFNQNAKPLTKQQARHFRQNLQIATRYVHSYEMILQFFGMKLRNRVTGEITRTIVPRYKDRYDQTLLSAYHNHLRVTRILCSLTEVGFAFYARQWCKFLKRQIYEHNGRLIRLKHMDIYKHWRPYQGDHKDRSNKIDIQDTPNIYLRQLWKQQGYNPLVKERSKWSQTYNKNKATITLNDESSDDEKVEIKNQNNPGNQSKNQQKQEYTRDNLTVNAKSKKQEHHYQPVVPTKQKKQHINKIQAPSKPKKRQTPQQIQIIDSDKDSFPQSDFSISQQSVEDKVYGRRGSKQYQKLKSELSATQDGMQRLRLLKLIKKQQEYQSKLQQQIKARLNEENDNHVKRQMQEIRNKFSQRLEEFRQKGRRHAQTIEEREKRMMIREQNKQSPEDQTN